MAAFILKHFQHLPNIKVSKLIFFFFYQILNLLNILFIAGGSGIHRPIKVSKSEKEPGAEYRASKAKGDMTIKGKQTSYAYLPLTRSSLNKRYKIIKKKKSEIEQINLFSYFLQEKNEERWKVQRYYFWS